MVPWVGGSALILVALAHLVAPQGMGKVKLFFRQKPHASIVIDGTWKQKVSMSVPMVISPADSDHQPQLGESGTGLAPGLPPGSTVDLIAQAVECDGPFKCGKFKILSVMSC